MQKLCSLWARVRNPDMGILLIRIALAAVFMYHGWGKVTAMDQTIQFFGAIGITPFWTYVAAYAELLGGIAMLLGIFVPCSGILLAITMAVAIYDVHWTKGFSIMSGGYEYALVLLIVSVAMVVLGPGRYSVEALVCRKRR